MADVHERWTQIRNRLYTLAAQHPDDYVVGAARTLLLEVDDTVAQARDAASIHISDLTTNSVRHMMELMQSLTDRERSTGLRLAPYAQWRKSIDQVELLREAALASSEQLRVTLQHTVGH